MGSYTVEGTDAGGHVAGVIPIAVERLARRTLGSPTAVEREIDEINDAIRDFWDQEPDEVMRACSAYSSRLTELYVQLHRVEGRDRQWRQVRTQQVVPTLEELDRQFKQHSRMVELRKQDLDQMRKMT